MIGDKYKRAYKFIIEIAGINLIECDRISGIGGERGAFGHMTAEGREIPLTGQFKMSNLEIHGANPSCADFFAWYNLQDPPRLAGTILICDQSGIPTQTVIFSDMIPAAINLDDLDRKTEDKHGSTYKVACSIISIT